MYLLMLSVVQTTIYEVFYVYGIVHRVFVSPGHTVNQKFYLNVLKRLRESLRRNHVEKWGNGYWFLHHDNALPKTAFSVQQFLG